MDVSGYLAGWRERSRQEAESALALVASARAAIPDVVEVLRRFGATRIWLIGSLPRGTFHEGSDLDFMVEGLDEEVAWRAAGQAADLVGFAVDVIPAALLRPEWRAYHEKWGERLVG